MASTTHIIGERIDYAALLPHRTKIIILSAVLLSTFLAALDQTIVSTALPAIISDFNGIDLIGWVSTSYLLASTAMVPICGKLSDLYGRKIVLVCGIIIFLVGSALCGLSWNMISLIGFRVIQALGAAALTSTAFVIPADLFVPAERAKYIGLFGSVLALASVVGPFVGGFLTDALSWHWVFYINLPLGLIALGFVLVKMPALKSGVSAKIDWLGTVLLILAVVPLMLGLTLDKTLYPWNSPFIMSLFVVGIVATGLFLYVESRVSSPIISLELFRNRTYAVGIAVSVLSGAGFFGALLFLSLFMVNVTGLSATEAGSAQIPLMVALVLSGIIASLLVQRFGRYKLFMIIGFIILIIGLVLMARIDVTTTAWDITWRMFIVGLGVGPSLPLLSLAIQNAVPFDQVGAATATRQFFQQLGQSIGSALFGAVLATTLSAQISANVRPIVAQLPPNLQQHIDLAHLTSSASTSEDVTSSQVSIGAELTEQARAPYLVMRERVTAALRDGDGEARQALLSSDATPAALKTILADSSAGPDRLAEALSIVEAAQEQAVETAETAGQQLSDAVKQSFAASITGIYAYSAWLSIVALVLLVLFLPELPLRTSNQKEEPVSAFH
jgi:EmrB/QacA subfamily drug resistance transporter